MQSYPVVTIHSKVCHVPSTLYISLPSYILTTAHINCFLCSENPVYLYCVHQECSSQLQGFQTDSVLKVLLKSRGIKSTAFLFYFYQRYQISTVWSTFGKMYVECYCPTLITSFLLKSVLKLRTLLSQTNGPIVVWIRFTATPGPSLVWVQYLLEK